MSLRAFAVCAVQPRRYEHATKCDTKCHEV